MNDSIPNPASQTQSRPLTCLNPVLLLTVTTLAAFFIIIKKLNKNASKKEIPGPRGWPILGNIPHMIRSPLGKMREFADEYGPIYNMKIGPKSVVVLNTAEAVKDAFITNGAYFSDRPSFFSEVVGIKTGIVLLQSGKFHHEQRGFFYKVMSRMDVNSLDCFVETHFETMKQTLIDSKQTPVDICNLVKKTAFASIGQVIFGKNIKVSQIQRLVEGALENNPIILLSGKLIPECIKTKLGDYVDMVSSVQKCFKKILAWVESCHENLDGNREFSDLINGFLSIHQEIKEDHETSSKIGSPFVDEEKSTSHEQIAGVLLDCHNAGVESTTAQMCWLFYHLAKYPEVQRKIQEEMDRVIGKDVTPSIKHKRQHTYTMATINETLRIKPTVSLGAPHASQVDASILGYHIPADTMVLTNLWAVHMDPNHWDNPNEFRPERFLDDKGNLKRPEAFYPFSIGKRQCIGETIAKNMMFLIVAHVLRHFNLSISEEPAPGLGKQGINYAPNDFTVIAVPRSQVQDCNAGND